MADSVCRQTTVMRTVVAQQQAEVERLTQLSAQLRAQLADAQDALEQHQFILSASTHQLDVHRCARCIAVARPQAVPAPRPAPERDNPSLSKEEVDALRGMAAYSFAERCTFAEKMLDTDRGTPASARSLVEFMGIPYHPLHREAARKVLIHLEKKGKAVHVPGGRYLHPDSPLLPRQAAPADQQGGL